MQPSEPVQAAAEDATAHLLGLAINHATPFHGAVNRANTIADICHGLPGLLTTHRRQHLSDGLRYLWRTASAASGSGYGPAGITSTTTTDG
jgi:hypothetical protein